MRSVVCAVGLLLTLVLTLPSRADAQYGAASAVPDDNATTADTTGAPPAAHGWQHIVTVLQQMNALMPTLEAVPSNSEAVSANSPDAAAQEQQAAQTNPYGLEIDGLVVDETRSKHGRDFYDIFYSAWEAPDGAINYTVRIQEQPGRGMGTVVAVQVNDDVVYRTQLQPRYEVVEQAAHQAVAQTQRIMEQYDVSRRIF